ncbi:tetratricopeptide repeat protein, partial [uncultured Duncaniella sp.]
MATRHHLYYICITLCLLILASCSGAKMSVADEQLARGEYFDAQKTYRKIYNKLNPREERKLRGEVAAKLGECYTQLGQNARAAAAYQNALRYGYPDST